MKIISFRRCPGPKRSACQIISRQEFVVIAPSQAKSSNLQANRGEVKGQGWSSYHGQGVACKCGRSLAYPIPIPIPIAAIASADHIINTWQLPAIRPHSGAGWSQRRLLSVTCCPKALPHHHHHYAHYGHYHHHWQQHQ